MSSPEPVSDDFSYSAIPAPGVGGYDQSWYPVARAIDVAPGRVLGENYFGGRVIIYRGKSGTPHVMSAYCRHFGASLCTGDVFDDEIRCRFHHWRFGPDGQCRHIPSGDPIPVRARLFAFPTRERYGLIWCFNGPTALYDLPELPFPDAACDHIVSAPHEEDVEFHMVFSNSYDFPHLRFVHGLQLVKTPTEIRFENFTARYEAEFIDPQMGPMKLSHRFFGSNCFYLSGSFGPATLATMVAAIDLPNRRTRLWVISATPKTQPPMPPEQLQGLLKAGEGFGFKLMQDDSPITHNIRFAADTLVASDWATRRYLDYIGNYPRYQPPVI